MIASSHRFQLLISLLLFIIIQLFTIEKEISICIMLNNLWNLEWNQAVNELQSVEWQTNYSKNL